MSDLPVFRYGIENLKLWRKASPTAGSIIVIGSEGTHADYPHGTIDLNCVLSAAGQKDRGLRFIALIEPKKVQIAVEDSLRKQIAALEQEVFKLKLEIAEAMGLLASDQYTLATVQMERKTAEADRDWWKAWWEKAGMEWAAIADFAARRLGYPGTDEFVRDALLDAGLTSNEEILERFK